MINESEIETLVRLRLFEALSQAESRYKSLVENLHDVVFQYDSEWKIVFLNQAWQESLGYNIADGLNRSLFDFIVPEDREAMSNVIRGIESHIEQNIEVELLHNDGDPLWFELSITPGDEGGVGLLHNIDHHKNRKKQLESEVSRRTSELVEANNTKDQFFAIIAHDLRGPIGSQAMMLNHIAQTNSTLSGEFIQKLSHSTNNIYKLLDNLLIWARAQKGQLDINKENFLLDTVTQHTLDVLRSSAEAKGVSLYFTSVLDSIVYGDQEMLSTVIRNLINNSIKFTKPGGEVRVSIEKDGGNYIVSVKDSGVGLSVDKIDKLFIPGSSNASSLGTQGEKGTGLGLLLCKEFIDVNGGKINVESSEGKGSRFWFTVPEGTVLPVSSTCKPTDIQALLVGLPVLLAEDDLFQLQTSASLLNEMGVYLFEAEDGKEALFRYFSRPFSIVILDIDMPYLNGVELASRIVEQGGKKPLIIALSSYSKAELEERYKGDLCFDGYLNKPLNKEELLGVIMSNPEDIEKWKTLKP